MSKAIESNKMAAIQAGRAYSEKRKDYTDSITDFIKALDNLDKDWFTRTKGDKSPKGLAVNAVRLDLQAREKERGVGNPDDAWNAIKNIKRKPATVKTTATYKGSKTGKVSTGKREPKRNSDQIFAAMVLEYAHKVASNTKRDNGAHLTSFQRDVAPHLRQIAELITQHKIKVTK